MNDLVHLPDGFALPITGRQPEYPDVPWTTGTRPFAHRFALEVIEGTKAKEGNQKALKALSSGASSLLFRVQEATDLSTSLQGIRLDVAPVHLVCSAHPHAVLDALQSLPDSDHPEALHGSVNMELAEHWMRRGQYISGTLEQDIQRLHDAISLPMGMRVFCANGGAWAQEERSSLPSRVAQLAYGLGSLAAQLDTVGWQHADRTWLYLEASDDYLGTVALCQAARTLWASLCLAHGAPDARLWISGKPALPEPTEDAAALVGVGIQQQALWLGGCDEIWITPIHESAAAYQWARQQTLVLAYENGLHDSRFPLRGAYTLDAYTSALALETEQVWKTWSDQGGFWHHMQQCYLK